MYRIISETHVVPSYVPMMPELALIMRDWATYV